VESGNEIWENGNTKKGKENGNPKNENGNIKKEKET
jgi:hypothetical protein